MLTCQRDTVDGWVKLTFNENGQLVDYVGNGSLGDALEKIFSASLGATGLSNTISSLFTSAQLWVQRRDPLTLDLDGDSLETVALNPTNPIYFDHDGDGNATATGWISPDDGFLALDRNANGVIDNGREP